MRMSGLKSFITFYSASRRRMPLTLWLHEKRKDGSDGIVYRTIAIVPALVYGVARNVFGRKAPRKVEHDIAMVTIIKNEGRYIKEWVDYHRLLGINRFYLYDNESTDDTREILAPYVHDGTVVLRDIAGSARQLDAYNDALSRYGKSCKYMAFVDADEFFVVDDVPLVDFLDAKLKGSAGGLAFNWMIFGSSGRTRREEGLVIERFTRRADYTDSKNKHVKQVVRPHTALAMCNPHFCRYLWGYHAIDIWGRPIQESFTDELPGIPLPRLNHYFTKSFEEFKEKRARGCADEHEDRSLDEFYDHDCNDVVDTGLLKYAEKIAAM